MVIGVDGDNIYLNSDAFWFPHKVEDIVEVVGYADISLLNKYPTKFVGYAK